VDGWPRIDTHASTSPAQSLKAEYVDTRSLIVGDVARDREAFVKPYGPLNALTPAWYGDTGDTGGSGANSPDGGVAYTNGEEDAMSWNADGEPGKPRTGELGYAVGEWKGAAAAVVEVVWAAAV
jgi:hypothetical protein